MNVYKLKNGKTQGAFQLPLKNEMAIKTVDGQDRLKKIHYIPGTDSIFVEDYKGDEKPSPVWFEDGEIRVSETNYALNEIMQKHAWFNKHYVLVNEEATAKKEVETFEAVTKASNAIIMENDENKLRAMAMSIISLDAINWETFKCKAQLLNYAKNHSNVMIAEMAKKDYEARYIAALAFSRKLVKYNLHHTAVVWNQGSEGIIVRVADGETGVDKLGALLSKQNETSESILKSLGELTDELFIEKSQKDSPEAIKAKLRKEVEAELRAEMKAEAKQNAKAEEVAKPKVEPVVEEKAEEVEETTDAVDYTKLSLEELQAEYTRITEKNLSIKYAKDREWMIAKINSVQS